MDATDEVRAWRDGARPSQLIHVLGRREEGMTIHPESMSAVYRHFLAGDLPLEDAAHLLRQHAQLWNTEAGSLKLDTVPDVDREKAAQLFSEAIQPILAPYLAGEITSKAAARQLAPLVFPVGVFALNFTPPTGPAGADTMARFAALATDLAELEDSPENRG